MAGALVLGDELVFPSEFLAFIDLKGAPRTVTIESLSLEELARKRKKKDEPRKLVARLVGKKKKLVLNRTNCDRIAEVYGAQAKEWIGKPIVIQPDKDRFGREMVDCIRVNVALTKKAAAATGKPLRLAEDLPEEPEQSQEASGDEFPDDDEAALAAAAAEAERRDDEPDANK